MTDKDVERELAENEERAEEAAEEHVGNASETPRRPA